MRRLTRSGETDTDVVVSVHMVLILIIHVLNKYDLSRLNASVLGETILIFYIFISRSAS